jgi:O-antigen ligase
MTAKKLIKNIPGGDRWRHLVCWVRDRDEWFLAAVAILPASLLGYGLLLFGGSGLAASQARRQTLTEANKGDDLRFSCKDIIRSSNVPAGETNKADSFLPQLLVSLAAVLVGVTVCHRSTDSWLGLFNYLPFLLVFVLTQSVLVSLQRIRRFLKAVVASSWLVSILGFGQVLWGWEGKYTFLGSLLYFKLTADHAPRPTSIFTSPNSLAIFLVMVLAIAWGLWLDTERSPDSSLKRSVGDTLLLGSAIALALPLLLLTSSRNGWLVALVGVVVILTIQQRWRWLAVLGMAGFLPIGAALNWLGLRFLVPAFIWQRLVDSFNPESQSYLSVVTRWQGWQLAAEMVRQRPWTGWGWQSFGHHWQGQVPPPTQPLLHAHQLYLSIAAEGGLLVLGGFLAVWGWIVWHGWQAWYRQTWGRQISGGGQSGALILGVNVALLCYFCSGLLDAIFFDGRLNALVWMVLASANRYSWWCRAEEQRRNSSVEHPV